MTRKIKNEGKSESAKRRWIEMPDEKKKKYRERLSKARNCYLKERPLEGRTRLNKEQLDEIEKLYKEGKSGSYIARVIGVSSVCVNVMMRKLKGGEPLPIPYKRKGDNNKAILCDGSGKKIDRMDKYYDSIEEYNKRIDDILQQVMILRRRVGTLEHVIKDSKEKNHTEEKKPTYLSGKRGRTKLNSKKLNMFKELYKFGLLGIV